MLCYNFHLVKKKLSIALVSSYAFTEDPSGVKDFILGLKFNLAKKGCKVIVIAPGSKNAQKEGLVDYVLGKDFRVTTDQTEFRIGISRKITAQRILKETKPDIIVIHEPFVPAIGHTIISAMSKRPDGRPSSVIVGQFHARREDLSWGLKAVEFIGKHIIRRPELRRGFLLSSGYISTINNNLDGRIAVSHGTRRFWQKRYDAEYRTIYNGINTDELSSTGPKIKSWTYDHKRIILFAGRHDVRKGIDDLIKAFNILTQSGIDDIRLKITGKGEMTKILQEMVKKLELQKLVEFVGVLPSAELVKAYRTADLVVAPSTGGEGFNRTIAEARSCGTLVVCTDIEGQKEAIGQDLSKFMAKPKNPRSLAKQIKIALSLPNMKKQKIRINSRKEIESRFGWKNIAQEHLLFYKSLVSKYGAT